MPCCEVCGSSLAGRILIRCSNQAAGCQAACHTFCLPGPKHSSRGIAAATFTCFNCSEQQQKPQLHQQQESLQQHTLAKQQLQLEMQQKRQNCANNPATAAAAPGGVAAAAPWSAAPSSTPPAQPASNWTQLPTEILLQILQHVPLHKRLSSCALVSTAWAAAAAAAPVRSYSLTSEHPGVFRSLFKQHLTQFTFQLAHLQLEDKSPGVYHIRRLDLTAFLCALQLQLLDLSGLRFAVSATAAELAAAAQCMALHFGDGGDSGGGSGSGTNSNNSSRRAVGSSGGVNSAPAAGAAAVADVPALAAAPDVSSQQGVPVGAFASLIHLRLCDVSLRGSSPDHVLAAAFMQLTRLQHLCLRKVWVEDSNHVFLEPFWGAMRNLTHLEVTHCQGVHVSRAALDRLSPLCKVEHLAFGPDQALCGSLSWLLPFTRLTALSLESARGCGIPAPGFAALPKLQALTLLDCSIQPAVFAGMTGLQCLHLYLYGFALHEADILPQSANASGVQRTGVWTAEGNVSADAAYVSHQQRKQQQQDAFFGWLQLQPLTSLTISMSEYDNDLCCRCSSSSGSSTSNDNHNGNGRGWQLSAAACAAITASAGLKDLHLSGPSDFRFPEGRQMLALTSLTLQEWAADSDQSGGEGGGYGGKPDPCIGWDSRVRQVVRCCPNIRELYLLASFEQGAYPSWLQPTLLLPLAGLTSLSFDGFDQQQMVQLLALTGLRSLSLYDASVSDEEVRELGAHTQLTELYVNSRDLSRWMPCDGYHLLYIKHDKKGHKPVWQQLLERCEQAKQRQQQGQLRVARQLQVAGVPHNVDCGDSGYLLRPKKARSYRAVA